MKKKIYLAFLTLLSITICAQNSHAGNLLLNPGFERGNFPPDNWDDWSGSDSDNPNNGVAGFSVSRELAYKGNKAVGKILYGMGKRWGGFSQTVNVSGGRIVKASGWVMNSKNDVALGKDARVHVEVKFLDESETEIRKIKSPSIRSSTKWTKLSLRGTVPQKSKKAIFSFVLIGSKGSRGKVFFDNASLIINK